MQARWGGAAIVIAVLLGSVSAQAEDEFARSGFYAGGGALLAIENFSRSTDQQYKGGFDLQLGYRVSKIISVETELEWAGFWNRSGGTEPDTEINIYNWSANLKGNLPLGRISPYAGIGVGFYKVRFDRSEFSVPGSTDDVGAMMKFMAGIDFYVTKHVVLTPAFSYNFLFNGNDAFDYYGVSARATFRF